MAIFNQGVVISLPPEKTPRGTVQNQIITFENPTFHIYIDSLEVDISSITSQNELSRFNDIVSLVSDSVDNIIQTDFLSTKNNQYLPRITSIIYSKFAASAFLGIDIRIRSNRVWIFDTNGIWLNSDNTVWTRDDIWE